MIGGLDPRQYGVDTEAEVACTGPAVSLARECLPLEVPKVIGGPCRFDRRRGGGRIAGHNFHRYLLGWYNEVETWRSIHNSLKFVGSSHSSQRQRERAPAVGTKGAKVRIMRTTLRNLRETRAIPKRKSEREREGDVPLHAPDFCLLAGITPIFPRASTYLTRVRHLIIAGQKQSCLAPTSIPTYSTYFIAHRWQCGFSMGHVECETPSTLPLNVSHSTVGSTQPHCSRQTHTST